MKADFQSIVRLAPCEPHWKVHWEELMQTSLRPFLQAMKQTRQNPVFHGEGSVLNHTRLVCEALAHHPAYQALPERKRQEVFLAALLHDVGKIRTTRLEDGIWVSPKHSVTGSRMVREFLWLECGLCGTEEAQIFRETVCSLVRYHMTPGFILDQERPERLLRTIASIGERAEDFSLELLCLLSEADMLGRVASDVKDGVERIQLCAAMAEESGCLSGPGMFADSHTRRAYLAGRNVAPEQKLYDDTWGEVILMSGLPGTGKDTWIARNLPEIPVLSLDRLRRQMGIRHGDNQGRMVQAALEQAREYLRKHQTFVWNATSLTDMIRQKQISLFESYHASVRIVYLEAEWQEQLRRNAGRSKEAVVPEAAIRHMLQTMKPPMPFEAETVEWVCSRSDRSAHLLRRP